MSDFTIAIATTTAEIERCWPVMRELRPELDPDAFVPQGQLLQDQGYTLAYLNCGCGGTGDRWLPLWGVVVLGTLPLCR